MVDTKFVEVIWCYGMWQSLYTQIQSEKLCPVPIRFHEGLYDFESLDGTNGALLCIIDDLMVETHNDSRLTNLFTKTSHHKNLSAMFLSQNLFFKGKNSRDISLNSHYLVLFKNVRDRAQINHLARQISPNNPQSVVESYEDCTKRPWGYVVFDFKPTTNDDYRIRTNIFPSDEYETVYVPRVKIKRPRY